MAGTKNHSFTGKEIDLIREKLLEWYHVNKRDLPWRNLAITTRDADIRAYSVWVSEVMLQQTQVVTVIDYYNRWMKKWPSVVELSMASHEEVKEMWSGLGYYKRATRLWEGACKVAKELEGKIPSNSTDLVKQLPGVGKYTAGAIASIAYSQQTGVLDGNVTRVLCRVRAIGSVPTKSAVNDHLWFLADELVDPKQPGDFNQALMELGACVCTPKNPDCLHCPVREHCIAHKMTTAQGISKYSKDACKPEWQCVEECHFCLPRDDAWDSSLGVLNFPRKPAKKKPKEEQYVVGVIHRGEDLLIVQRPSEGLLAGMWEFPLFPATGEENQEKYLKRCLTEIGIVLKDSTPMEYVGEVVHMFSHVHHSYCVYCVHLSKEVNLAAVDFNGRPYRWVPPGNISQCALSTAMRKVYKQATQDRRKRKHDFVDRSAKKGKQIKLESLWSPKQRNS